MVLVNCNCNEIYHLLVLSWVMVGEEIGSNYSLPLVSIKVSENDLYSETPDEYDGYINLNSRNYN